MRHFGDMIFLMTLPETLIRDNIQRHSELVTQHQPAYPGKVVRKSGCGREATKRESINPPAVEGFFIGRIYSYLPCPDRCQNG